MCRPLVQKATRRNTGSPRWRSSTRTLQLSERTSSQEESRRLWGDSMNIWRKRYFSVTHMNSSSLHEWRVRTNDVWLMCFDFFLTSGMGVRLWEAPDFPKLSEPQHHGSQSVCHHRLPVCTDLLVEADGRLSGSECRLHVWTRLHHWYPSYLSDLVWLSGVFGVCRRSTQILRCPCMASCCGESSSTLLVWASPTLTRWRATPYVPRWTGTQTPNIWLHGERYWVLSNHFYIKSNVKKRNYAVGRSLHDNPVASQ